MLATVLSYGLNGIDGFEVLVEVNLSLGLPVFEVVGLPDTAVKESRERVRTALKNSGYGFPDDHLTVNLAPADMRKEGPVFDLPIAVGVVAAEGRIKLSALEGTVIIGELSLDGSIRPMKGALPVTISAKAKGIKRIILPEANASEVRCITGIDVLPARHLRDVILHIEGKQLIAPMEKVPYRTLIESRRAQFDFSNVYGQQSAKRALEIAAAGGHNVLMIGPPGSGKTLLASCMPTIMPDMTFEEALEATRIHSVVGSVPESGLLIERPFRTPHHTASTISISGGGSGAMPGEISKAHHGVLFLDELPEYKRDVLEALRQPMEDGKVTVTRIGAQSTYPSQFMLICSMNPCPCGNYGSQVKQCRCTPAQIKRYLNRISGPLLDRIDIHIEVESIPADRIAEATNEESSSEIRHRVEAAREVQRARYQGQGIPCNARLNARTLNKFCAMTPQASEVLKRATEQLGFSNRTFTRVMKVARTIADMAGLGEIGAEQVLEAVQYRTLDRKYWG